ncbi:MAG TPA: ABC transporter permease [Chitinophagaceae bacterium]|nr:ABC transporter permease [Chitinophagaceae bacterium]
MHKTWLIIKREYLSRVKKRSFIIVTLLVPVLVVIFFGIMAFLAVGGSSEVNQVGVLDNSGVFTHNLHNGNNIFFHYVSGETPDHFRLHYQSEGYTGALCIPMFKINQPKGFTYYGKTQLGLDADTYISGQLDSVLESKRMQLAGISPGILKSIKADINLITITGEDQKEGSVLVAFLVGYGSGFLIYFSMIFFGMMTMRGVMEEKTNRIAEVIISSVRPFQLMMGKIIGIAGVGLTQFFIWIVVVLILINGALAVLPGLAVHAGHLQSIHAPAHTPGNNQIAMQIHQVLNSNINFTLVIGGFLFYFLFGYLMYAALFAAVGSCVDQDAAESQALILPITLPILMSFLIMFNAIQHPNSALAIGASIFPLSSPLVMIARIPFGVPWTQLAVSAVLLIGGFIMTTWLAGKIYRTGILLYGKKVTLKEMAKWLRRRN